MTAVRLRLRARAQAGSVTKPVVAWVSGTCATLFKSEVQFGHAGARSGGESESAQVGLVGGWPWAATEAHVWHA